MDLTPEAGSGLVEQEFIVSPDGATVTTGWFTADEDGRTRFASSQSTAPAGPTASASGDAWYGFPPRLALWHVSR